jgi:mannose-1-phosphate guanylyltransferase
MVLLDPDFFLSSPRVSIDRALMEKEKARAVVSVDMGWRDLGSWPALAGNILGI